MKKVFLLIAIVFSFGMLLSSCEKSSTSSNDTSNSQATQCLGKTQSGLRCKNMTTSSSGYCYLHD